MLPNTVVLTAPQFSPVSTTEIKQHVRQTQPYDDDFLDALVWTATELFERQTHGLITIQTSFRQYDFAHHQAFPHTVHIRRGQVSSITQVQYYDTNDTLQTLSGYNTDLTGIPASYWMPDTAAAFPTVSHNVRPPILTDYVAGYSSADKVPQSIRSAIRLLACHFYERRNDSTDKILNSIPMGFRNICAFWDTGIRGEFHHRHHERFGQFTFPFGDLWNWQGWGVY